MLFIGNSYTAVNDLPGMFEDALESVSYSPEVEVQSITGGGLWLEDHLANPTTVATIDAGGWSHVVLQEQSYLAILWPDTFYDAAEDLANHVIASGATPVWFETWARREGNSLYDGDLDGYDPTSMQAALRDRYQTAATDFGGEYSPVGDTWEAVLAGADPPVLFSADGSHPSVAGTYLAACVFAGVIGDVDATDIVLTPTGVTSSEAVALRQAAEDATIP